jgi:hypothetical protein
MFLSGGKKGSQGQGFKIIGEKNKDTINMLVIYMPADKRGSRSLMESKNNFKSFRIFKLHRSCQAKSSLVEKRASIRPH